MLLVYIFDVTIVSVATTLLVDMLLFTMTRFDVMMLEANIELTSRLHVAMFDAVKLEVEIFEAVILLLIFASPMTSKFVDGFDVLMPMKPGMTYKLLVIFTLPFTSRNSVGTVVFIPT